FAKSHPSLKKEDLAVQNISDIHLLSNRSFEPDVNGDQKTVNFLSIVAVIIVIIGSINYINLITATSSERSKQSAMRRLLGSSRQNLIGQFLTEAILVNLLAFAFAILLIQLVFPWYEQLTDKQFSKHILTDGLFWSRISMLFIVNIALSGLYPALVLSDVKPVSVLRRSFTQSVSGNLLRKGLVIGQFSVAIVVLIASVVIYRQVSFMRNQELGMNITQTLVLTGPMNAEADSSHIPKVRSFIDQLQSLSMVKSVSVSGAVPGNNIHQMNTTTGIVKYGSNVESGLNYCNYSIDENFVSLMQMQMVAGRNFRKDNPDGEVLLNEESARLLGFKSPAAAIGQNITFGGRGRDHSEVIGVIKDFKQRSVKDAMLPLMHRYSAANDAYYSVKLNTSNMQSTIAAVEKIWKQQYPENSFEYFFLDDLFDQQYKSDIRFGRIIGIFSALTFFITCLGIIGLTAATISKRTKEIGIRKVLGASINSIVTMISGGFVKLVVIAILIASPIAWLLMNEWLKDFNSRISIGWQVFAIAATLSVLIAVITISFQSIRAALTNPVKSLKSE
ncbi:MAG: FtsX-like permease family protein, partial [Chitinophagaceae bacterium]